MGEFLQDFNFDMYKEILNPSRKVTEAYQNAARFLDTTQEKVLINLGMPFTARAIHNLAHMMPSSFDRFGDILHERHFEQQYPATPEFTEDVQNISKAMEIVIFCLDEIDAALESFVRAAENHGLASLARQAETLQIENSERYSKFLYTWKMYDKKNISDTSFDSWVAKIFQLGD